MPEATLKAFGDHGSVTQGMAIDRGAIEGLVQQFSATGVDVDRLGLELQDQGAKSFVKSWGELMDVIAAKGAKLVQAK